MNSLRCILLCALAACVLGHAVIRSPVPLNPNPTTSQPCGVTTVPANPTAAAQWAVGSLQTITWDLVASDGGSSTTAAFDPAGTGTNAAAFTVAVANGPFTLTGKINNFAIQVPAVTATSASGLVLFRMVSNTNWNSCFFVNVTNCQDCPVPPPPPPKCQKAANLNLCNQLNGQGVFIAADATPNNIDAQTRLVYAANWNNTNVFTNGASTECRTAYQELLCDMVFPPCPGGTSTTVAQVSKAQCQSTMSTCGLTTQHASLYNCSDATLFAQPSTSSASSVAASVVGIALALFALAF